MKNKKTTYRPSCLNVLMILIIGFIILLLYVIPNFSKWFPSENQEIIFEGDGSVLFHFESFQSKNQIVFLPEVSQPFEMIDFEGNEKTGLRISPSGITARSVFFKLNETSVVLSRIVDFDRSPREPNRIFLHDLISAEEIVLFPEKEVQGGCALNSGRFLAFIEESTLDDVSYSDTIRVYDVNSLTPIFETSIGTDSEFMDIACSQNSNLVYVIERDRSNIFDVKNIFYSIDISSGQKTPVFEGDNKRFRNLSLSPNGKTLAVITNFNSRKSRHWITLIDIDNRENFKEIQKTRFNLIGIQWLPNSDGLILSKRYSSFRSTLELISLD